MKEIGGYFQLDEFYGTEYYEGLISLNSARNALLYILRAKKVKNVYIPYFLCDSISEVLRVNGYSFQYYKLNSDFTPIFNKKLGNDEYLYIVNYYGQLKNEKILCLKEKYQQIIIDNTQAFFQKPIDDIDTIYSCRKFFGVADGAYVSTKSRVIEEISIDISKDRMKHILGRYEGSAEKYYENFTENEKYLDVVELKCMSKLTHNILKAIDYEKVKEIRRENYQFLASNLNYLNGIKCEINDGPFAYPFYIENGVDIRKILAKKKIYIPTLWPNVLLDTDENDIENKYTKNILPLPCDQRYKTDDMNYLIDQLIKSL